MFEFILCSAIQGHHVYKDIWENPTIGEELKCQREIGNSSEFCKKTEISVSTALSTTATFSLEKSTSMIEEQDMAVDVKMEESCKSLSESESPSLPLSVLCSDSNDDETLIVPVFDEKSQITTSTPSTVVPCSVNNNIMVEEVVCSPPKKRAKKFNEEAIIMGEKLTDVEINFAQRILKAQFPRINGLQSTLFQCKPYTADDQINENKLQNLIVFCKDRSHWILATTIKCETGEGL